jgi:hypothetical protein
MKLDIKISNSMPIRKYVSSRMLIRGLCVLNLISLTSFAALRDHFGVSAKAPADSPELSACPHLKNDLVKRTPRRAKHHLTHTSVESALMAGTPEATTRGIKVH